MLHTLHPEQLFVSVDNLAPVKKTLRHSLAKESLALNLAFIDCIGSGSKLWYVFQLEFV